MRKAERLFQIVNILRSRRQVVTAQQLSETLEVSERTIYRDIQALSLSGIPIEGEAGVGYRLVPGFNLPPIMFEMDELEAIRFGVRMVQAWGDKELAHSATQALDKIHAVLPESKHHAHHQQIEQLIVPDFHRDVATRYSDEIRQAAKQNRKIKIKYQDERQNQSSRQIWPLGLIYWGRNWTVVAWCEIRQDYRLFRLDRIMEFKLIDDCFEPSDHISLMNYIDSQK